jgi:hypothetical protein
MGEERPSRLSSLPEEVQKELRWSYVRLEHPSFAARLSDVLASPLEEAASLLPKRWRRRIDRAVETSIQRTLSLALSSMGDLDTRRASNWTHKLLVAGSGALGGYFGPLTVLAELPVTTALMIRSIADIARSEGEDLKTPESRLACVQVFALGGRTGDDEAAEIGYYGLRLTLGLHFENILEFAGPAEGVHIPAAINFVRAVAARFGVVISDKVAVQLIPIAGALSGVALNLAFMQHYQDVARGHFIVRRLERRYGVDMIREVYRELEQEDSEAHREYSPLEGW